MAPAARLRQQTGAIGFSGGRGLYASKIEFGPSAFDESDATGLLVIATKTAGPCQSICFNHGLGCYDANTFAGGDSDCLTGVPAGRYCLCGRA